MIALIDASSLMHRAWHASGQNPTQASSILDRLLRRAVARADTHLLMLDGGSARRKALDPTYKAHRPPQPELWKWIDTCQQHWRDTGWECVYIKGWEADDLAASAVANLTGDIRLVTSDKDWWMLIDERTYVLRPGDWTVIDKDFVYNKTGVHPHQLLVYKSLVGDASDGVNGVPGIGPKRAATLIQQYWPHTHWWSDDAPEEVKKRVGQYQEIFEQASALMTLYTDAPQLFTPQPLPFAHTPEPPEDIQGMLWLDT